MEWWPHAEAVEEGYEVLIRETTPKRSHHSVWTDDKRLGRSRPSPSRSLPLYLPTRAQHRPPPRVRQPDFARTSSAVVRRCSTWSPPTRRRSCCLRAPPSTHRSDAGQPPAAIPMRRDKPREKIVACYFLRLLRPRAAQRTPSAGRIEGWSWGLGGVEGVMARARRRWPLAERPKSQKHIVGSAVGGMSRRLFLAFEAGGDAQAHPLFRLARVQPADNVPRAYGARRPLAANRPLRVPDGPVHARARRRV